MQHEYGSVRGHCIYLIERWHSPLGELKFGPSADHTYPLRRWCALRLLAQHTKCVSERRHPIPAKLQVVIETATNQMEVDVVKTGNHHLLLQVDNLSTAVPILKRVAVSAHHGKPAIFYGDSGCAWACRIERCDCAIDQD